MMPVGNRLCIYFYVLGADTELADPLSLAICYESQLEGSETLVGSLPRTACKGPWVMGPFLMSFQPTQ